MFEVRAEFYAEYPQKILILVYIFYMKHRRGFKQDNVLKIVKIPFIYLHAFSLCFNTTWIHVISP